MPRFPGWSPYPLRDKLALRQLRRRKHQLTLKCRRCAWAYTTDDLVDLPSDSSLCLICLRNPNARFRSHDQFRTPQQVVKQILQS